MSYYSATEIAFFLVIKSTCYGTAIERLHNTCINSKGEKRDFHMNEIPSRYLSSRADLCSIKIKKGVS